MPKRLTPTKMSYPHPFAHVTVRICARMSPFIVNRITVVRIILSHLLRPTKCRLECTVVGLNTLVRPWMTLVNDTCPTLNTLPQVRGTPIAFFRRWQDEDKEKKWAAEAGQTRRRALL